MALLGFYSESEISHVRENAGVVGEVKPYATATTKEELESKLPKTLPSHRFVIKRVNSSQREGDILLYFGAR